MNANEFKAEVLTSDIAPENFEAVYNRFHEYQLVVWKTLNEVHRLCEENGIHYQLAYGSLLGVIRDGGQIPWDYDVDVIIPYEDKNRMIEALKKDLSKDFRAYCPEIDPNYRHTLMRITPVGYHYDALHVDVFYIIGVPDDPEERKAFLAPVEELFYTRTCKKRQITLESLGHWKAYIRIILQTLKYLPYSYKRAEAEYDRICSKYKLSDTHYCAVANLICSQHVFLTETLWDTKLIELSSGTYRITKDYDNVLCMLYGDYKTIPCLEQRLGEVIRSYRKLEYYRKHYSYKE